MQFSSSPCVILLHHLYDLHIPTEGVIITGRCGLIVPPYLYSIPLPYLNEVQHCSSLCGHDSMSDLLQTEYRFCITRLFIHTIYLSYSPLLFHRHSRAYIRRQITRKDRESPLIPPFLISHPTQVIPHHPPSLTPHTNMAPKHIIRINCLLDLQQAFVITTPECLLKVRFIPKCLFCLL